MKQKNKKHSTDTSDIRAALPEVSVPQSLSPENIENLVAGVPQKKSTGKTVKKAIACALAACIAVCGLFALDAAVYAPSIKPGTDGAPAYAQDYSKLLSVIKDYRRSEKFQKLLLNPRGVLFGAAEERSAETADEQAITNGTNTAADTSKTYADGYSQTNTRVEGIGEADFVKTDGKNLYVVRDDKVFIMKILDGGKLEKIAELSPLDGIADEEEAVDDGDEVILYRSEIADDAVYFDCYIGTAYRTVNGIYVSDTALCIEMSCLRNGKIQTGIAVYDITDASAPALKKIFMQDGDSVSSRAAGNSFILVTRSEIGYNTAIDEKIIPEVAYGGENGLTDEKITANSIAVADADSPDGFLIVSKINTSTLESKPETAAMLGSGTDIYCTDSTLYVCSSRWDSKYEKSISKLMSFDITGDAPKFKASGEFEGSVPDTFSIDEYNGYVRVAAQLNDCSRVYVLDGSLKTVGTVDNIAPGESIRAVRFSGSTGYVVTFYQTDPLFVLDLTDPTAPVIVGELKIPGFSSYLHPVGENLLLGVGTGGTDEGTDGSAKLSLFDVSDPKAPKEIDTLVIKDADFNTDYKAFVTDSSDNTFLVPYDSWSYRTVNDGYIYETVNSHTAGILRIAVENGKIVKKNNYTQTVASAENASYYQFTRAAFVGGTVYGIDCWSPEGRIVSFDKTTGEKLSETVYCDDESI